MLSHLFLGMSLVGSEWVLYLLLILSIISVAVIFERLKFYKDSARDLQQFRESIRRAVESGQWDEALKTAHSRQTQDMESSVATALLQSRGKIKSAELLSEVAQDAVIRAKLQWEKNLATLATIGSNSPFVGLFGTVLGIIKAFHDLSKQAGTGAQTVTAGISEALIATAVGILVAIPAVVAFNFFQRRVKSALSQAEAMKSFLIGKMGS